MATHQDIPSTRTIKQIQARTKELIAVVRKKQSNTGVEAFLQQYRLSTEEGIALMCLSESLLRIPDNETRNNLIREKITRAN